MSSRATSSTLTIQTQFHSVNSLLVKTIQDMARISDPMGPTVIQDLKNIVEALEHLQGGVAGHLQSDKHELTAFVDIGRMINSSLGLKQVLEGVMDALIELTQAERGLLMLRDKSGELAIQTARGLDHADLEKDAFAFSRTIVQRVAASGEPVLTTNAQEDPRFGMEASVISLQLRSSLCAPLKLKTEVIGVIYVDNRAHTSMFKENDLRLLSAFADQAAIAIHNAQLFENLQAANRSLEAANEELKIAYDATLKGWVRALDLRDKETRGHTQRVTAMTRLLAKEMGLEDEGLMDITRGALLHDIGKMGIPDSILLKPGALSAEERETIKQHPVLAYEMLSPIQFLHGAIDIPYCHHEKWDGTGYPRGLKDAEIPLMARIFSIIDVWDALTSDRPYRQAMDPGEVQEYLRAQASVSFDPRIVETFLGMGDLSEALEKEQALSPV